MGDFGLADVLTEFTLNSTGARHSVAIYRKRERQEVSHLSDDWEIAANSQHR